MVCSSLSHKFKRTEILNCFCCMLLRYGWIYGIRDLLCSWIGFVTAKRRYRELYRRGYRQSFYFLWSIYWMTRSLTFESSRKPEASTLWHKIEPFARNQDVLAYEVNLIRPSSIVSLNVQNLLQSQITWRKRCEKHTYERGNSISRIQMSVSSECPRTSARCTIMRRETRYQIISQLLYKVSPYKMVKTFS